ncbi:MAG: hypothetical protein JWO62_2322 [Acidimicrobiaceae bacterium]|nr:hypothetical protein [Acidimicrobiaceae bacterium]
MTRCCHGARTMDLEKLDDYQQVPYGTHAWAESYGRRNAVENVNGRLKVLGRMTDSFVYAFGRGAHRMATLMAAVAHNIKVAIAFPDVTVTADERARSSSRRTSR